MTRSPKGRWPAFPVWRVLIGLAAFLVANHLAKAFAIYLILERGWGAFEVTRHLGAFNLLSSIVAACFILRRNGRA